MTHTSGDPLDRTLTGVAAVRLRITVDAERQIRGGHPWLFADSIREQNREGALGELAVIYDRRNRFLALGFFDPGSPLRVRVLHQGKPQTLDGAWWEQRLETALARRQGLFDARTTGHRWINGESDGWPGLVLDRYSDTLVLKLYTAAWLPRLEEIARLIQQRLSCERIVLRLSRNVQRLAQEKFNRLDGGIIGGAELSRPVVFLETGLEFEADVQRGQKTGFFLDQRENRRVVETLASGRAMLNAFSFSGGFSLYAARGRARSVIDLDISAHALSNAKRNFRLNQRDAAIAACHHETIQADVFDWLQADKHRLFDLIVLDPPSLAKRESERATALSAYASLVRSALQHLRPNGILVAASCSAHVTAVEFFQAVRQAATQSKRSFIEVRTTLQPPDHPATFKEAEYLKCIFLRF